MHASNTDSKEETGDRALGESGETKAQKPGKHLTLRCDGAQIC